MQQKLVLLGQLEVYDQAAQLTKDLLGLSVARSQIYRLTNHYGAAIEADLDDPKAEVAQAQVQPDASAGVVYVQADGAMLLTEEGYKETKLARIFAATAMRQSVVDDRGGHIDSSLYTAHLGAVAAFTTKLSPHLLAHKGLGSNLVFLSDGAPWLRQMMKQECPDARQILDFYHRTGAPAMSHIGAAGVAAFGNSKKATLWIDNQADRLLSSQLDAVLGAIRKLPLSTACCASVCSYLESNRDRMDYKAYRQEGLLIGSGAIESAHRTVIQKRLKRAGQRWGIGGCQRMLNLRVSFMSGRWELVRQQIEPFNYAMAA